MTEDSFGIVGTTIAGTYEVEEAVAEGGFGVLYRAHHGAFRAAVALKCMKTPAALAEKDQKELMSRFHKEAEVMFRLSAAIPAVVRPLAVDAFTTKLGVLVPYMALEWLEGETLDALVLRRASEGRPPLALKRIVRMLAPIARALDQAHEFLGPDGVDSISHCDLKPENIFLATISGETVTKILDFGIAKVRAATSQLIGKQSQSGDMAAFSPCYAAPEQWLPRRYGATGPWTDIWGMALTVVEAMAGHQIMSNDFQAAIGTTVDEKRRPTPRNEGVEVSDAVEQVFTRALAVDPRNRYPSMGEFWDTLEDASGVERSRSMRRADRRRDSDSHSLPPNSQRDGAPGSANAAPASRVAGAPPTPRLRTLDTPDLGGAVLGERASALPELELPSRGSSPRLKRAEPAASRVRQARNDELGTEEHGTELALPTAAPLSGAPEAMGPSIELADVAPASMRKSRGSLPDLSSELPNELTTTSRRAAAGGRESNPGTLRESVPGREPSSPSLASRASRASSSGMHEALASTPNIATTGQSSARRTDEDEPTRSTWMSLLLPLALAVIGIVVAAIDGGENQVAGIQVNWIAGGVAGVSIVWALWRMLG